MNVVCNVAHAYVCKICEETLAAVGGRFRS